MNPHRQSGRILLLPVLAAIMLLVFFPSKASEGAHVGIERCLRVVIPALFPFFVLIGLILRLPAGTSSMSRFFCRLFRLSETGFSVFLLGLVSGYPVGASAAAQGFSAKKLTREEAERLLLIGSYCGPGFILGTAGNLVFQDGETALRLLLLQALCAIWFGTLSGIRQRIPDTAVSESNDHDFSFFHAFTESVIAGGRSVLRVCAYVIFFSAATVMLPEYPLLIGLAELTGGIVRLQGTDPYTVGLCAFLMGFGGLAVGCQVLSAATEAGLRGKRYFPYRILFGLIFGVFAALMQVSHYFLMLPILCCFITTKIAKKVEKSQYSFYNKEQR